MRKGKLWGLLNYKGEVMLAPQFESLEPLSYDQPGKFRVTKGGRSYVIKEKGE
jgi:hypothetical protein